ncbi:hypothetical protein [Cryobacterium sp. 5I3]|uniref:hypothetical protein n=2 Tax=Bacteria TaxID=2 RepID=UPI002B2385B6|nr:hypothetical protein [Cryobacterium sp. 5I3]
MMSAEETGSPVCNDPDCAKSRQERDLLVVSLRDSTHAQLISRDIELGLRAELMQAKIDIEHERGRAHHEIERARERGARDLALTRSSTTWRIGRAVTSPVGAARRLLRRFRK